MKNSLLALFFLLFTSGILIAQEENTDMFDMTLEQLMNIEVESSTKSSVKIQKAPSVIRVYTKQDLERFNFVDLQDVLMSIPGMQIQQYRAGHQLVWIRGVQARYNNKVLLLIDGVPMRDSYYGNFNIDEMIPIEMIEKIEIINGPGSVLYGANSFSGVISITTKKAGKSIGVDYGTFNTFSAYGEFDVKNIYGHMGYYRTDGFKPELKSNGLPRDIDQEAQNIYGYLKYQNKGLKLNLGMMNYNYSYKYRSTNKDYSFERTPLFGSARYTFNINESSKINIQGYVNDYTFSRFKTKFINSTSDSLKEVSDNSLDTRILGGDIDYSAKLKNHNLIIGASWQRDQAVDIKEVITFDDGDAVNIEEQTILDNDVSRDNIGLFIQDVWEVNSNWSLTTGVRYDILSDFDNQFSYRAGVTGGLTENLYTKLLYGTAYRVPSYREYIDVDAPNLNLEPEKLQTLEFQFGYMFDQGDINLTFYNNSYENFISEIVVDSIAENGGFREVDDEMSFNFKSRDITGLELNTVLRPNQSWAINFGFSYIIKAKEDFGTLDPAVYTNDFVPTGNVDITFLSSANMYLLLNYNFLDKYSVGINSSYFGSRNVPDNYQDNVPVANRNPSNANGFVKIDFVGSAKFNKHFLMTLKVANLLDSKFYSPPFGGNADYDTEWTGRTIRCALVYKF